MAVKTTFSEHQLRGILSQYHLGEYTDSIPISKGSVQTNFFLQTTHGRFVFRYYENRSAGSALFESHLIHYLKNNNYPCPAPLRNRKGEYVGIYNEKPYAIFEFVEGEHLEQPNEAQKKQLIQKVAELHNITSQYRPRYKAYRWNYTVELCWEMAQKAAKQINTTQSAAKLKWFESELLQLHLPQSLPKGICHCDFHFSNILFKDGEFKALIDFDDANYTFLTYDLATLLNPFLPSFDWNTWFHFQKDENVFDFKEASKTVLEYMNYRPLSNNEKRHLFDVYKLHIMFDSIWYFTRGDGNVFYEKRKIDHLNHLGRERFYNEIFGTM